MKEAISKEVKKCIEQKSFNGNVMLKCYLLTEV